MRRILGFGLFLAVIVHVVRSLSGATTMPRHIRDGAYYEFNRPNSHYEVGREIIESMAQMDVTFGRDVYTARGSDAKSLAKKIVPMPPTWHPAHQANFFPHYYPGIGMNTYGHIFYGRRGESFESS
jgi:hypothetical protein